MSSDPNALVVQGFEVHEFPNWLVKCLNLKWVVSACNAPMYKNGNVIKESRGFASLTKQQNTDVVCPTDSSLGQCPSIVTREADKGL